ncbi:acyltransferase [Candidatus Poribacteria bacterium]|nr:acyltransferase [Candidatus Poribacteria bacterium]
MRRIISSVTDAIIKLFIYLEPGLRWKYYKLRNQILKQKMKKCGENCIIRGGVTILHPEGLSLGNNIHIGNNALIDALGGISIGDNTHIARNLTIYSYNHNYEGSVLPYDDTIIKKPVVIEKNVWIGADVKIAPGVTIGEGSIIGMGSLVGKDVPPLAIMVGKPLRIIKYRDRQHYDKLEKTSSYGGINGTPLKSADKKNGN